MMMTPVERLMLVNQYRILGIIDPANKPDHDRAAEALEQGYEDHCDAIRGHIEVVRSTTRPETIRYVLDVLDMFYTLQGAYDALDDRAGIDPKALDFLGFDGNGESSELGFARFYLAQEHCYEHLRRPPKDLNSHCPTRQWYEPMLAAWRGNGNPYDLSKADIVSILKAGGRG